MFSIVFPLSELLVHCLSPACPGIEVVSLMVPNKRKLCIILCDFVRSVSLFERRGLDQLTLELLVAFFDFWVIVWRLFAILTLGRI